MNAKSWPAVFVFVVLAGSGLAYSWNGRGHMFVACVFAGMGGRPSDCNYED